MSAEGASSGRVRPLERGHPWNGRFFEKSPLFWPLRARAAVFQAHEDWPSIAEIDAAWADHAGIHFQEQLPKTRRRRRGKRLPIEAETLYDSRIELFGWVPTRPRNWHDYLNALVWASFSRAKKEFHRRQHAAVVARIQAGDRVLPGTRTREMDGLAILDEGGMLMLVAAPIEEQFTKWIDTKNLEAVSQAIGDGQATPILFGHALYETLLGDNAAETWAMVTVIPTGPPLPPNDVAIANFADRRLGYIIATTDAFSNPDTYRNLPLDERVLCPRAK